MTKDRETLEEHHATALERLQEKQGELSSIQTVSKIANRGQYENGTGEDRCLVSSAKFGSNCN